MVKLAMISHFTGDPLVQMELTSDFDNENWTLRHNNKVISFIFGFLFYFSLSFLLV